MQFFTIKPTQCKLARLFWIIDELPKYTVNSIDGCGAKVHDRDKQEEKAEVWDYWFDNVDRGF